MNFNFPLERHIARRERLCLVVLVTVDVAVPFIYAIRIPKSQSWNSDILLETGAISLRVHCRQRHSTGVMCFGSQVGLRVQPFCLILMLLSIPVSSVSQCELRCGW